MKNIIEVIKDNRKVILKRGLITVGTIAGLIIAGKVLTAMSSDEEVISEDILLNDSEEDSDEDSDEE